MVRSLPTRGPIHQHSCWEQKENAVIKKLTIPVRHIRPSVFAELIDEYEAMKEMSPATWTKEDAAQLRRIREAQKQEK